MDKYLGKEFKKLKEKVGRKMVVDVLKFNENKKPNFNLCEEKNRKVLGKYGLLKLQYLKQNRRGIYTILLMKNELKNHLISVEKIAKNREDFLINEIIKKEKIDEKLKEKNQIKWIRNDE